MPPEPESGDFRGRFRHDLLIRTHCAGMETLRDAAVDLLLGSRCPGCDRPGRGLCRDCEMEVRSGRIRFAGRDPSPPGFPLTMCAGEYAGVLRRVVVAFKDEALVGLASELSVRLMLATAHLIAAVGRPGASFCLVPIPSGPSAVRRRGLDHTMTLARGASRRLRIRAGLVVPVEPLLRPMGGTRDQVGLDASARWENRNNHFRVTTRHRRSLVAGTRRIPILVDDITTTGATLASATHTLRVAGQPPLGAAVVAATVRRHAPRGS